MNTPLLKRIRPEESIRRAPSASQDEALAIAAKIVNEVRADGSHAAERHAVRLGDLNPGDTAVIPRADLDRAVLGISQDVRDLLVRTADRIRSFAIAQRESLSPVDRVETWGRAGHTLQPVETAGCYAPGGRFPLPSSVLMTVVTARAAGVNKVWVASPRPDDVTLAAAAIAGADGLLAIGGAQAIAALAFGSFGQPPADFIAGPGNRYVTAAKKVLFGEVGIDMLAGPSELLVLADANAPPDRIAADLLAQSEHDEDAVPMLVATDPKLPDAVDDQLALQLETLPTRAIASKALQNGFSVVVDDLSRAIRCVNEIAPEHLELMVDDPSAVYESPPACGALFIGGASAEVFGDYGAGPNHVLPTGRGSRFQGGLSVLDFLRVRTYLEIDELAADSLARDSVALARLEGLEGHALSAECRITATEKDVLRES